MSDTNNTQATGNSTMTITPIEISERAFMALYPLVSNHLNPNAAWPHHDSSSCLFETYGDEFRFVCRQDPRTVWTLVDCDGEQCTLSGLHIVNRIGYLVSTVPVPHGVEITVYASNE